MILCELEDLDDETIDQQLYVGLLAGEEPLRGRGAGLIAGGPQHVTMNSSKVVALRIS